MTDKSKQPPDSDDIIEGVQRAVSNELTRFHINELVMDGVSSAISEEMLRFYVNELVINGVYRAMSVWLDDNHDEVLAAISGAVRRS